MSESIINVFQPSLGGLVAEPSINRAVYRSLVAALRPYIRWQRIVAAAEWDLSDIYLASYPKSGVTWICLAIANVLARLQRDRRRIDLFTVHDYVPDLHANPQRIRHLEPPRVIKTHERFPVWSTRVAVQGGERLRPRVIYLVRDGRDVMASMYAYRRALTGVTRPPADFLDEFHGRREDWVAHVREWIAENNELDPRERLIVRYESAKQDPETECRRIMTFVGLNVSDALLAHAVRCSDAREMRKLEDQFGGGVEYTDKAYRFVGEGRRTERDAEMDAALDRYREIHRDVFERMGY